MKFPVHGEIDVDMSWITAKAQEAADSWIERLGPEVTQSIDTWAADYIKEDARRLIKGCVDSYIRNTIEQLDIRRMVRSAIKSTIDDAVQNANATVVLK